MSLFSSLGFIGGGQMAEALIHGVLQAKQMEAADIFVIDPNQERLNLLRAQYGVTSISSPQALCERCSNLVIAIKPQAAASTLSAYQPHLGAAHLLISIMAGLSLARLQQYVGRIPRLIRAMPNTPALVGAGATAFSAAHNAHEADRKAALQLFSAVGFTVETAEPLLDAVTGLSGSGPAYVFTFLEALVDGGVLAGLPRPIAEQLALHTVHGAAKLALESNEGAAALRGKVTSPGGTTIAGLQVLEQGALRGLVMTAVQAASRRSQELGA